MGARGRRHWDFRMNRRMFIMTASALACTAQLVDAHNATRNRQLGVQLYSLHDLAHTDLLETLTSIRKIGFQTVEFETTCIECGVDVAKALRARLDELGLRCPSTLCNPNNFYGERLSQSLEIASILGCNLMVMPHPDQLTNDWRSVGGWRNVVRVLNEAVEPARAHGIRVGYHNHAPEFLPLAQRHVPIEIIASETDPAVCLELDVANCLASDGDPVEFLKRHGPRVVAMHFKDWSRNPARGFSVALGQGSADWRRILNAAEPYVREDCYFVEMEPQDGPALDRLARDYSAARKLLAQVGA